MRHSFSVDLRGIVDLLGRHLYPSPRAYLRELLQNAVDALSAHRPADPRIAIEPPSVTGDGSLRVHDNGVGLTEAQVHELLATIGRSSKRDELGFSRQQFLGQFGIGLLSCFLVADDVEVVTRSAAAGDGAATVRWVGHADGHYTVEESAVPRNEPGTTVTLRARRGSEHWLSDDTVLHLARHFGSLLPYPITVGDRLVTEGPPPWQADHGDPRARREELLRYAETAMEFRPFDVIDLKVPAAGLTGVAFVLPTPLPASARTTHRVYLKRMLLGERVERLLPDWAFFARCVVDAGELRPTADREQLYEDDLLEETRQALGEQLRAWLVRLSTTAPSRLNRFLSVHHLGVKALAVTDTDMLRLVDRWLPVETSDGEMPLAEFRRRHGGIRYTAGVDEFRQFAGVAAAQGMGLVNAGYAYDAEILKRLPLLDPEIRVERLDPAELATRMDPLDPDAETSVLEFLTHARRALDRLGCDPVVRAFEPVALPALYLEGREATRRAERQAAIDSAEGAWADMLDSLDETKQEGPQRPQLILNHNNPLVRRVTTLADPLLIRLVVEAMYGHALLQGHHPMRPADTATLNRSFLGLVEWAVHNVEDPT
ncbi:HSP90 family protein [Actinomadura rugatobispora]|uniref:HSP90 family protein n=1 Tax=Actinomadura rugatobispora TaxID=1994 RepID=A0ABW1A455_9ACTN|nr:HSP90 family protein [Actinomadura rugatobispora]